MTGPAEGAPGTGGASDLRLDLEAEDARRRRMGFAFGVLVAMPFLLLGSIFVLAWPVTPVLGLVGLVFVAFGGTMLMIGGLRRRSTDAAVSSEQVDGNATTILRRRPGVFRAAMGTLGVVAASALALAVAATTVGRPDLMVLPTAAGVVLGWIALGGVSGRYSPGSVTLTTEGLTYRFMALESVLAWDHVTAVTVDETTRVVTVASRPGGEARHRYLTWPRGQRAPRDGELEIRLRDWSALATDVGRFLAHYAEHPESRTEIGTPAALDRWRAGLSRPVLRTVDAWALGGTPGPWLRSPDLTPQPPTLAARTGT